MGFLSDWLGRGQYLPHGYCITWSPDLLWSMVGADGVIAAAYYSIPFALVTFVRRRGEAPLNGIALLFSAFIFACGTTHLMSIWTLWEPDYGLETLVKIVTAVVSLATAIALWPLIPKALQIPRVADLQQAIAKLEDEIRRRRQVEGTLLDTQDSLAITLATIGAGIITTDRDGRITRINAEAEAVTGWHANDALGRLLWDVWWRADAPASQRERNPVDLAIELRIDVDTQRRMAIVSRTGKTVSVEATGAVSTTPQGEPRGLIIVFRDMTRLDRAEVESQRLAAIVESSHDAIISKTLDGRISSWNQGAEGLFGYKAEEIVGQPITTLIPVDHRPEEDLILAQMRAGARVLPFETVRQRKDGSLVDVSVTISPVRDGQGEVVGASKIVRDISQQRRHEELRQKGVLLEAENRQILAATKLKNEFLANMSHELRTPLTAIIGFADLMYGGKVPADSPKHHEFLGYIRTSGQHLLRLINDVLDLSKVESGKFEFFPEVVDLAQLVDEVISILSVEASRKGLRVEVMIDPALPQPVIDPGRLKQVLYNYLSNAIKFSAQGGRVTVHAAPQGSSEFRLEVEDEGIGIGAENLRLLFVDFQQLDAGISKRHAGTGLGLALTRRLVEAQGGSVAVRSVQGQGSVFSAVLPLVPAVTHPIAPQSTAGLPASGAHILVIEDLPSDQALIARGLTDSGYQVSVAGSARQAIELASERPFAAITLDLVLPDRSGLEVLSAIRGSGPNQQTPVVVLTLAAEAASFAGFTVADVLSKPVEQSQLLAALGRSGLSSAGLARARLMVVDDDPQARALMAHSLDSAGFDSVGFEDGHQALAALETLRPAAIILDLMMPEFDGFAVLDQLRQRPTGLHIPVFIWTQLDLEPQDLARLQRSARAILQKGHAGMNTLLAELRQPGWHARLRGPLTPD
jgi:PAS domain S-box-containing protein